MLQKDLKEVLHKTISERLLALPKFHEFKLVL